MQGLSKFGSKCSGMWKAFYMFYMHEIIATTLGKTELPDIYEQAQSWYLLDKARMLRFPAGETDRMCY